MEVPSEDVFASRVMMNGQNFRIFEGIYESSAFHLQRFLNMLRHMPDKQPYVGLKRAAFALLQLSEAVAERAGVIPFETGQTEPLHSIPNRLVRRGVELLW